MADGRRNNKGQKGSKNGGGRKSKAEELGLPLLMKASIKDADWKKMFQKCVAMANTGSSKHFELLLQYQFGKATEHKIIDLEKDINIIIGE